MKMKLQNGVIFWRFLPETGQFTSVGVTTTLRACGYVDDALILSMFRPYRLGHPQHPGGEPGVYIERNAANQNDTYDKYI